MSGGAGSTGASFVSALWGCACGGGGVKGAGVFRNQHEGETTESAMTSCVSRSFVGMRVKSTENLLHRFRGCDVERITAGD